MSLRRAYHRHVGHQRRFLVAAILTIVVVAYVAVPWGSALLEGLGTYGPGAYQPRDFKRGEDVQRRITDPASWTAESLVDAGLFVLLAVVWYLSVSAGRPGSRPR